MTQLFVPGGWWKASEIPEEDLLLLQAPDASGLEERIGCLISEVVVPGWTPEQHEWLDEAKVSGAYESTLTPSSRRCGVDSRDGSSIESISILLMDSSTQTNRSDPVEDSGPTV